MAYRTQDYAKPDGRLSRNGTFLQAILDVGYSDLVTLFGEPNCLKIDSYKTDAEWVLRTPAGVATIYNYKTGSNYLGEKGLGVQDIRDWHVGGGNYHVFGWVEAMLEVAGIDFLIK